MAKRNGCPFIAQSIVVYLDLGGLSGLAGVAVGDQFVIFSEQALSSGERAELGAGVEAEAIHGY